jgi:histone H2A
MLRTRKKTITIKDIQSAVQLNLTGELIKNSVHDGAEAINRYNESINKRKESDEKTITMSRSTMAGLLLPITRIEKIMMELVTVNRKSNTAAVYLAAVCEYLLVEVMISAKNIATDKHKVRITPRHIMLAVNDNDDLKKIYGNTVFAGGV